jgi:hypothetical protein
MFPAELKEQAMSTLNLIARIVTVGAPMVAEVQGQIPL